jgi:hypothetical protein
LSVRRGGVSQHTTCVVTGDTTFSVALRAKRWPRSSPTAVRTNSRASALPPVVISVGSSETLLAGRPPFRTRFGGERRSASVEPLARPRAFSAGTFALLPEAGDAIAFSARSDPSVVAACSGDKMDEPCSGECGGWSVSSPASPSSGDLGGGWSAANGVLLAEGGGPAAGIATEYGWVGAADVVRTHSSTHSGDTTGAVGQRTEHLESVAFFPSRKTTCVMLAAGVVATTALQMRVSIGCVSVQQPTHPSASSRARMALSTDDPSLLLFTSTKMTDPRSGCGGDAATGAADVCGQVDKVSTRMCGLGARRRRRTFAGDGRSCSTAGRSSSSSESSTTAAAGAAAKSSVGALGAEMSAEASTSA